MRLLARVAPGALLLLMVAGSAACGAPRAARHYVASTIRRVPTVQMEATASVSVLEGEPVVREFRQLYALPRELTLDHDRTIRLLAAAYDQFGAPIESNVYFHWLVDDPRAGTIQKSSRKGSPPLFRASAEAGDYPEALTLSALVETEDGGVTAISRHVRVTVFGEQAPPEVVAVETIPALIEAEPGQIVRLQAVGYDAVGRIVPRTRFDWQTVSTSIGIINRLGYLTVTADPGDYPDAIKVVGSAGQSEASSTVTVRVKQPRLASTEPTAHILPSNARIITGAPFKFQAVTLDGAGRSMRVTDVKWVMSDDRAGTIESDGRFVASSTPGTYLDAVQYSAVIGGDTPVTVTAQASVTVRPIILPNPLVRVEPIPGNLTVSAGDSLILRALGVDENDRITPGVTMSWEVVEPGAGTVGSLGQFKAGDVPGTYQDAIRVVATQETRAGTVEVTAYSSVTIVGTMTTLQIVPGDTVLRSGQAIQFRAVALDENGVQIPGVLLDWSVADPDAGKIGLGGLFESGMVAGEYTGTIQVRATQRLRR